MAVITISRQYGSGGEAVARLLCDRLGYRYFDKDLMAGLGAQMGLAPSEVVDLPEDKHQVRSLVERLFGNAPTPFGDPGEWALMEKLEAQRQLSVQTFQELIRAAYDQDNVIVVGRGGQIVLRTAPDVLHVRLVGPIELRIGRVKEHSGVTEDVAREQVHLRDQASADYVKRYYNIDSADPLLYDVVINMSKLTPEAAAGLIVKALDSVQSVARPELPEGVGGTR